MDNNVWCLRWWPQQLQTSKKFDAAKYTFFPTDASFLLCFKIRCEYKFSKLQQTTDKFAEIGPSPESQDPLTSAITQPFVDNNTGLRATYNLTS